MKPPTRNRRRPVQRQQVAAARLYGEQGRSVREIGRQLRSDERVVARMLRDLGLLNETTNERKERK